MRETTMADEIEDLRLWVLRLGLVETARRALVSRTTLYHARTRATWNPKAVTLIALDNARRRTLHEG